MAKPHKKTVLARVIKEEKIGSIIVPLDVKSCKAEVVAIGDKVEVLKVGNMIEYFTDRGAEIEIDGEPHLLLQEDTEIKTILS
ncbi:MAG: hypothetical protein ACWA5P_01830 [bacterium]